MRSIRILFCVAMAVLVMANSAGARNAGNKLYDDFNDGSPDVLKWSYYDCGLEEADGKLRLTLEASCRSSAAMFAEVPKKSIESDVAMVEMVCNDSTFNDCGAGSAISAVWFIDPDTGNYFWTTIGLAIFNKQTPYIAVGSYQWNPNSGEVIPGDSTAFDNINGNAISLNTAYTLKLSKNGRRITFYVNDIELFVVTIPKGFKSSDAYNSGLAGLNSYIVGNAVDSIISTYDNVYAK